MRRGLDRRFAAGQMACVHTSGLRVGHYPELARPMISVSLQIGMRLGLLKP